jgi:hypothetical protein
MFHLPKTAWRKTSRRQIQYFRAHSKMTHFH